MKFEAPGVLLTLINAEKLELRVNKSSYGGSAKRIVNSVLVSYSRTRVTEISSPVGITGSHNKKCHCIWDKSRLRLSLWDHTRKLCDERNREQVMTRSSSQINVVESPH